MTTNSEVIGDALREINVIAEGQTPSAEQGLYGLRKLNAMVEEWTERDVDLGYYAQTDASADCPIPAWAESAVKSNLAIALAPKYGASISAELAVAAMTSFGVVQRKCMVEKMEPANMDHMPVGSGRYGSGFDITHG
jgi:hypothetical protein